MQHIPKVLKLTGFCSKTNNSHAGEINFYNIFVAMNKANLKSWIVFLRNKYLITLIFLVVWLLFFDRYDFITQYKSVQELNHLIDEKEYYLSEIAKNQNDLQRLNQDPEYLERYAREKYLMKKPGEEVFIIIDESPVSKEKTNNKTEKF